MTTISPSRPAGFGHHLKTTLTTLGLKPLALGLHRAYHTLYAGMHGSFRLDIDGVRVIFVTEDRQSKWFFHHRYRQGQWHEPPVTRLLLSHLAGSRAFADVGAHLGYFGCIAGAIDRDRQVFLFEMNHNLAPIIRRNLDANGITRGEVINHPVSDRKKTVSYDRDATRSGLSMAPDAGVSGAPLHQIETITLDDYFLGREVVPDVIKIDVQGAELEALKGAERLLREHHPVLFLEIHPTIVGSFGATVQEIYDLLTLQHGYKLQRINEHRGADKASLVHDVAGVTDLPATTHMLLCT